MIDKTSHDSGLVSDLMEVTVRFPDCRLGNLPDERKDRRVHSICRQKSSAGIEQARSRND